MVHALANRAGRFRKVLLGWELGGGLGHAARLLPLSHRLAEIGHQPILAFKNLDALPELCPPESAQVFEVPWNSPTTPRPSSFRAASYADVLAIRGFAGVAELYDRVTAWDRWLDRVQPDVVVCDHSPTLCLAATGRLPTLIVGTGFTVPPVSGRFYPVLDHRASPIVSQDQVFSVICEVQRRRGQRLPPTLPQAFAGDARFVTTLPELDCYPGLRTDTYVPTIDTAAEVRPATERFAFFAYLAGDYAGLEILFSTLSSAGLFGAAYFRDGSAGLRQRVRRTGHTVFEHPADLREVLSQVPVVIHHGGVSTAQAALVAGRPQVLLPRYLEQELVALTLGNLGVATSHIGWVSAEEVVASLQDFREDQGLHRRARHLAEAIRGRGPCDGATRIVAVCESLTCTAHGTVAGVPAGAGASRPADWSLVHAGSGRSTSSPGLLPAPLIVGAPRSGTTLLRMMVDSHAEVAIPSETVFLPAAIKASLASDRPAEAFVAAMYSHERWSDQHLDATEILAEIERAGCFVAAGRYELGEAIRIFYRMHARRAGKIRWGDKTPQYNHHLRLLGGLLPEARFIHLIRDGRDVALSIRSFWWGQKTVDEAAEWWSEQIAETRRQAAEVEHYLEVRFEDLVRDPRRELHRICEYLELPWDEQMLDYQHQAASRMAEWVADMQSPGGESISPHFRRAIHRRVSEPVTNQRIGQWRAHFSDADQAAFRARAGRILDACGYCD